MNGMGKEAKRIWIKDMTLSHKVSFLCLQETKTVINSVGLVSSVWGNRNLEFVALDSTGNSSGILTVWDGDLFQVHNSSKMEGFVKVCGLWKGNNTKLGVINVYAPQGVNCKKTLWENITKEMNLEPEVAWVVCGDFNEVRCADERRGSSLDIRGTKIFNDFISNAGLIDLRLGGRRFTWMNADGSKLSKLDRFLLNQNFLDGWPLSNALALPRVLSDHCPILLDTKDVDFGPIPFKLFNSWLNLPEFETLVRERWNDELPGVSNLSKIETLSRKLRHLKTHIKRWSAEIRRKTDAEVTDLKNKIGAIDLLAEVGSIDDSLVKERAELMVNLNELLDMKETATDKIRNAVWDFFNSKFAEQHPIRPVITSSLFKTLSVSQRERLEIPFSEQEVKKAVWNCGSNKAPGPDGFTLEFVRKFWDVVGKDFFEAVKYFEVHQKLNPGSNASFITLIPKLKDPLSLVDYRPINLIGCVNKVISKVLAERLKDVLDSVISNTQTAFVKGRSILDGPLMVNELISWAKKMRKKLLILKVDFAKAFDTLNWNFLDNILSQMGFGDKWRAWMQGVICTAKVSVLVNGSPTKEFSLGKGVRQGDPLAPFLFILAAEGLTVAMKEAQRANIFKGVRFNSMLDDVSIFQFADDAIFVGEWSYRNAKNLLCVLKCFEACSGLKINLSKSSLSGVLVTKEEVKNMARRLNCKEETFPFKYLGLPVGGNMNLLKYWQPLIEKFRKKLSDWKARTLSLGGRSCLCKSVLGALGTYLFSLYKAPKKVINILESLRRKFLWGGTGDKKKICWTKWENVIRDKQCGGLGIGSLRAFNLALLTKWRWREKIESDAFWNKVVRGCNGNARHTNGTINGRGTWHTILGVEKDLEEMGINLSSFLKPKEDGLGWVWELEQNGNYTVRSLRRLIDGVNLPAAEKETDWNRWIPNKTNILIWRTLNNRLPTRDNLLKRGIFLQSPDCPICHSFPECLDHVTTSCSNTRVLHAHLAKWVDWWPINTSAITDFWEKMGQAGGNELHTKVRKVIGAAFISTIWRHRNNKVFKGTFKKDEELVRDIQFTAFNWIRCRKKGCNILNWEAWICNPVNAVNSCISLVAR
ncbi:hypothetical protein OSB04_000244 [Centaurea solstitialis]|uniref:Reverse transcriptase domain-containing protein n=1 Tax=Centaurea solstitialis TaxID=347529 RepID=A0AA38U857_9ASTR|nr:hypothetical protein OSB04_000244 [Centaurea solstitialis]